MKKSIIILEMALLAGLKILTQNTNYGKGCLVGIKDCGFMIGGFARLVGVMRGTFVILTKALEVKNGT